jgi:mycoredoxin
VCAILPHPADTRHGHRPPVLLATWLTRAFIRIPEASDGIGKPARLWRVEYAGPHKDDGSGCVSEPVTIDATVTMYTTQWCAFCRRLKSQLARDGIEVAEVDIERDEAAASFVVSVNGGNMTVPTILFSDGTAMTNPSAAQVKERLRGLAANL